MQTAVVSVRAGLVLRSAEICLFVIWGTCMSVANGKYLVKFVKKQLNPRLKAVLIQHYYRVVVWIASCCASWERDLIFGRWSVKGPLHTLYTESFVSPFMSACFRLKCITDFIYTGLTVVSHITWLILPVVICLFQRLSHAGLSISYYYSETANSSL